LLSDTSLDRQIGPQWLGGSTKNRLRLKVYDASVASPRTAQRLHDSMHHSDPTNKQRPSWLMQLTNTSDNVVRTMRTDVDVIRTFQRRNLRRKNMVFRSPQMIQKLHQMLDVAISIGMTRNPNTDLATQKLSATSWHLTVMVCNIAIRGK
jgi:uncharacterized membrane protein YgaE (UPF0421/DUF939 family)